jgi:hypothetical protein
MGRFKDMVVQYLDFGKYHGKGDKQGSTLIRMNQMMPYWEGFGPYKYGAHPEALIFQKVYCTEDYKFPIHYPGVRILDICDPDWLEGVSIVETAQGVDAVVTPTESMAEFIRQFHSNVKVIPDRFDLDPIPKPKEHTEQAKTVVWFGYAHNSILMKPAMATLDRLNLNLVIISNDDPFLHQWSNRDYKEFYKFVKYDESTIYQELQKADFALLPEGNRPVDVFKSNNKAIKANLAGLPVARKLEEVELYMDAQAREQWLVDNYATIQAEYDICKSVKEYQNLIAEIQRELSEGRNG